MIDKLMEKLEAIRDGALDYCSKVDAEKSIVLLNAERETAAKRIAELEAENENLRIHCHHYWDWIGDGTTRCRCIYCGTEEAPRQPFAPKPEEGKW